MMGNDGRGSRESRETRESRESRGTVGRGVDEVRGNEDMRSTGSERK